MTHAERKVEQWNAEVAVGDLVDYVSLIGAAPMRTATRTPAKVLGGHTAVVWLEDVSGCVGLDWCTPAPKEETR